jgi:uncharacterized repeat protein (TIGR03803 family)
MVVMNGALYGVTGGGGAYGSSRNSYGTIFKVDGSGREAVVYSFKGGTDGSIPEALIALKNKLYGTTNSGGGDCEPGPSCGYGTVFEANASGDERVLYSFKGGEDGSEPFGGLVAVDGKLYGTTWAGGSSYGTVFEVSMSGQESVIYRFGSADTGEPYGSLIARGGEIYGTTDGGQGTVFEMSTVGEERLLHAFTCDLTDGYAPWGGVVALNGSFYGTTSLGPENGCHGDSLGTVYELSKSGKERLIYDFSEGASEGGRPEEGLTVLNGELYGSTQGSIFEISTSGRERVLHYFDSPGDGLLPSGRLTIFNGKLYGVTGIGGAYNNGTIFELTP